MKILIFADTPGACKYYRVEVPFKYLALQYNVEYRINDLNYLNECDIIIFQRSYSKERLQILNKYKTKKICIYEVDDDPFSVPKWNMSYNFHQKVNPTIVKLLKNVHLITCSTKYLKNQLLKYNKNIEVLPNSLDIDLIDNIKKESLEIRSDPAFMLNYRYTRLNREEVLDWTTTKKILFWGGSPTHLNDLEILTPIFNYLFVKYKDLIVIMFGCAKLEFIEKTFKSRMLLIQPTKDIYDYYRILSLFKNVIGLAPLCINQFNKSKSNLKFLEYSIFNYYTVATDVENYSNTINENVGTLCNNDSIEWKRKVSSVVQKKKYLIDENEKFVRQHYNISNNVVMWYELYKRSLK